MRKVDIWYFFHYRINPIEVYLRRLNKSLNGWHLVKIGNKFGIAPNTGPMMVGDEMSVNDPNIPLDNPHDTWYGYFYEVSGFDLPHNPLVLKTIWETSTSIRYNLPSDTGHHPCPQCATEGRYYGSGIFEEQICPKCYGLSAVYQLGRQEELGRLFVSGSRFKELDSSLDIHFTPLGLLAFIELYERFGGGVGLASKIFNFITRRLPYVLKRDFPMSIFYKQGEVIYLRSLDTTEFFDNVYINMETGVKEILENPEWASDDDLPSHWDWTKQFQFYRILCKNCA